MTLLPELPKGVRPLVTPIVDTADAAFVMSLDCQFLAWGSRAQQLFGFSPPDVLGRYCYDVLPARDASGQCLCSVNCPMVVAARYGYSVPPRRRLASERNRNRAIWVRLSPIVLRAPHGAICAILVLATDVSRYKLTEQLVRWIASRLDAGDDSSTFAVVTGRYRPYEDLVGEAAENVGLPRELANELASRYAELNPWPEVKDVLRTLHNAGVPVGVVTNCSENAFVPNDRLWPIATFRCKAELRSLSERSGHRLTSKAGPLRRE